VVGPSATADLSLPSNVNTLARALRANWEETGSTVALQTSIRYLEKIVQADLEVRSERCMYLHNLGTMILRLWEANGRKEHIEQGITYLRRANDEASDDDPGLPMYLHNLSSALASAWLATEQIEHLEEAVDVARRAVAITPRNHPDRLNHMSNFAGLIMQLHHVGRVGGSALAEAVELLVAGAGEADPRNPATLGLWLHLGQAQLLLAATLGDDELAAKGRHSLREAALNRSGRARHRVKAASRWGTEAARVGNWEEAGLAYSIGVKTLAQMPGELMAWTDQENLVKEFQGMASDAAAAILEDDDNDPVAALRILEAGRSVLLGRVLTTNSQLDGLRKRDSATARKLAAIRELLDRSHLIDAFAVEPLTGSAEDRIKASFWSALVSPRGS
jgi:hypothetical protein